MTIVGDHPNLNHTISTIEFDIRVQAFMEHVVNALSFNEEMNIIQTTFNVKIINIPRGQGRSTFINLAQNRRTKWWTKLWILAKKDSCLKISIISRV